jgi:hypothetical protein
LGKYLLEYPYEPGLHIESKIDFWLVCWYATGIYLALKVTQGWYNIRSLPGWYW